MLTHERLLAYHRALTFHRHVVGFKPQLPRSLADLYDIALASAGESAAALDLLAIERAELTAVNAPACTVLDETAALTVGLIRRLKPKGPTRIGPTFPPRGGGVDRGEGGDGGGGPREGERPLQLSRNSTPGEVWSEAPRGSRGPC